MSDKKYIFISYAIEDYFLAKWLAGKLSAEGYYVWMDNIRLKGGDIWKDKINEALSQKSFIVLALLSNYSIKKQNPSGERIIASEIEKKENRKFLIPIKVDDINAIDLGFDIISKQYIDFSKSWATGLRDVLDVLSEENVPRGSPVSISSKFFLPENAIKNTPDIVISNLIKFTKIPDKVNVYYDRVTLSDDDKNALIKAWAFKCLGEGLYLSFYDPPSKFEDKIGKRKESYLISCNSRIKGIYSINLRTELLKKHIITLFQFGGCQYDRSKNILTFVEGQFENNKLKYELNGRKTFLKVVGERKFALYRKSAEKNQYRLGTTISILPLQKNIYLLLRNNIHLELGDIPDRSKASRYKAITKVWFNKTYLRQFVATFHYLIEQQLKFYTDVIQIGREPINFEFPYSINEGFNPMNDEEGDSEDPTEVLIDENDIEDESYE